MAEHKSVVTLPKNATSDARFKRFQALVEDTYEAFLSVPLVNRGEVIGVVNVHHRQPYEHTPEEVSLVTFIGEQMGSAIGKSVLEDQNVMLREQLETRKLVERAEGHSAEPSSVDRRRSLPAPAQRKPPSSPSDEGTGGSHHPVRRTRTQAGRLNRVLVVNRNWQLKTRTFASHRSEGKADPLRGNCARFELSVSACA